MKMATCGKCGDEYPSGDKCKPCRNKKLRDKRRENAESCVDCGAKVDPTTMQNRGERRCPTCYPIHRRLYRTLHSIKNRSKGKDMQVDLDLDWMKEQYAKGCAQLGVPFSGEIGADYSSRHPMGPSVDQIIPGGGYTKDNCQLVCWWYNAAKQRFTDEEVLELCRTLIAHQDGKSTT